MTAHVTVAGAPNHTPVSVPYYSANNAILAQQLAYAITAGVAAGSIQPADNADGFPPAISPPATSGEYVISQVPASAVVLPTGYAATVVTAPFATVFASSDEDQTVLSGSDTNLSWHGGAAGSGTIFSGGGTNQFVFNAQDSGAWLISIDTGTNQVFALNTGDDTISAGVGSNIIRLGAGDDFINTTGSDLILGGGGSETINAFGSGSDLISGLGSDVYFVGGSSGGGVTLTGGSGSDTFFGSTNAMSAPELVKGGSGGNNFLQAGYGLASLFGGGNGDQLFAAGANSQLLQAGIGNETLDSFSSAAGDTLVAGAGNDVVNLGIGADTVVAGSGMATVNTFFGDDVFQFISGHAGGTELVAGLVDLSGVTIALTGYTTPGGEKAYALDNQSVSGGNLVVKLSDNTTITFQGITQLLTNSNFS